MNFIAYLRHYTHLENFQRVLILIFLLFPITTPAVHSIVLTSFLAISIFLIRRESLNLNNFAYFLTSASFIFWIIFSILWSDNFLPAFRESTNYMFILIAFFIFIFSRNNFNRASRKIYKYTFVFGVLIYTIILSYLFFIFTDLFLQFENKNLLFSKLSSFEKMSYFYYLKTKVISSEYGSYFMYDRALEKLYHGGFWFDFFKLLFYHHTYIGILLTIANIVIFDLVFNSKNRIIIVNILIFSFIVNSFFLLLMESKMNFILNLMFSFMFVLSKILTYKNFKLALLILTLITFIGICKKYEPKNNFQQIYNVDDSNYLIDYTRVKIYNVIICEFLKSPIIGVGIGDEKNVINNNEMIKNDNSINKKIYNSHSMLLKYLLTGGIIGLLLFIISQINLLKMSVDINCISLFFINLVFIANSLFENIFDRFFGMQLFLVPFFLYYKQIIPKFGFRYGMCTYY